MYIKNILKAFDRNTLIEAYLGNTLLDYGTVEEFMNSGLMTYMEVDEEEPLFIQDDRIIICIKDVN